MSSRAIALGLSALLLLCAPSARAADVITATSSVEQTSDPGFAGLYKYTVHATWSFDRYALGHLDLFLDLGTFHDTCSWKSIRFPWPAGSSTGLNESAAPCTLKYFGLFLCRTDPTIGSRPRGATLAYVPLMFPDDDTPTLLPEDGTPTPVLTPDISSHHEEPECHTARSGSGTFYFYSAIPPAMADDYPEAIAIQHGREVDYGTLTGSLPLSPGHVPAGKPVVINEFLVKPVDRPGQTEFIELFNTTNQPIDISGWELCSFDYLREAGRDCVVFPAGTVLGPGGFLTEPPDSFSFSCDSSQYCDSPQRANRARLDRQSRSPRRPAYTSDLILRDEGGFITLKDDQGTTIDTVGYGNKGGAPGSYPLIVPAGASRPPGFAPAGLETSGLTPNDPVALEPETLAVSTQRIPNGNKPAPGVSTQRTPNIANSTPPDSTGFGLGPPTPDAVNSAAAPDLGSSVRINGAYPYPWNGDGTPPDESIELINPKAGVIDVATLLLSDASFIQPLFRTDAVTVPLERDQKFNVYHGLNGSVGFEFDGQSRMEIYEQRAAGLVKVDGMGWYQDPYYFEDNCIMRTPDGAGPAGGWDWKTSGGGVNLLYVNCPLKSPSDPNVVDATQHVGRGALLAPTPNPSSQSFTLSFVVGAQTGPMAAVRVAVYDVAGRRIKTLAHGSYPPGRYALSWDGAADDGAPSGAGVYFARLFVSGRPVGETRSLIRIGH